MAKIGGLSLLIQQHNGSIYRLLTSVYPHYEWLPWKFEKTPRNFWDNVNNQKKFMEWAGKQLKINEMSDWYKVTVKDLSSVGGSSLVSHKYNNSLISLLSTLYPEYEWLPWKFKLCPKNFWNNEKNKLWFMNWAGKQLGIKDLNDWNKISSKAK